MNPAAAALKPRSNSSSTLQVTRPSSAPSGRAAAPSKKKMKRAVPKHIETVMPVPNKPLILEEKNVFDSGKSRLSW
jgi:hypothetical protein